MLKFYFYMLWQCKYAYLCFFWLKSLPFGGVKDSGFGRFAGVEGLRACCLVKSVVEDRLWPYIRTVIPKPIQVYFFPSPHDTSTLDLHGLLGSCGSAMVFDCLSNFPIVFAVSRLRAWI